MPEKQVKEDQLKSVNGNRDAFLLDGLSPPPYI